MSVAFTEKPFGELAIGERTVTATRLVTEDDVERFAALTGDDHPLHTDAQAAAAGPFGERIAHGLLVLSLSVGLLPLSPHYVLGLRRVRDATFKSPVRLGESITAEVEILELIEIDDARGLVTFRLCVRRDGQKVAVLATLECIWAAALPAADQNNEQGEH